ncbi:hypothetical protein JAAARDRAFT_52048 [Jaapia argillacea MUCL 33604]|uniref:Nucleoporin NUP188 n=1 Tax=Jaapia argillacea MUCL 33604 TaxID=933084 RepID=A0A067QN40_9AGAM|nr:hypothetical protein JAAARDRAFT_52048 [Jaapia argillacea MUCL 33604]
MSAGPSKRSNLIDVTYQQIHANLIGGLVVTSPDQTIEVLRPRVSQLRNLSEPYGKPSGVSRKKIESGSATLRDGVSITIEEEEKQFIFAISKKFQIDEVEALILFRSYLYNEGFPAPAIADSDLSLMEGVVEAITPFFFAECLSRLRVLIPLFRAHESSEDPAHEAAATLLPEIIPDGRSFADSVISEYLQRTKIELWDSVRIEPRTASRWAKQNYREQVVLLEVLFWTMWSVVPCEGPLVVRIFEAAYDTNLGSLQHNSTLMMDEEGLHLQNDNAALWILITVEVLELERVADPGGIEMSDDPVDKDIYTSSPECLKRIHEIVSSNGNSQFACAYMAWTFVLSRLTAIAAEVKDIPDDYRSFLQSTLQHEGRPYSKSGEPVHLLMAKTCLNPDVGFFKLLLNLLTDSPVFVCSVAWKTDRVITDPNALAFRSVMKGLLIAVLELVPVELVPDLDVLVEVWIALFSRSESASVTGICKQYWQNDWNRGIARRAIFDLARSRFPVQPRPLIRLLQAMTAFGFLDTDPLSTTDDPEGDFAVVEEREICSRHVFSYLQKLPTYTQVVPISACTGAHALYEKIPERYGSSSASLGFNYSNQRPLRLPGGSTLPPKTLGRLLSGEGADLVVICWQHEHSGWKVLLEILTDYVYRKRMYSSSGGGYKDVSFGPRGMAQVVTVRLEDIGMELGQAGDDGVVTGILDLVRSVIQDNPSLVLDLLRTLESGDPVVSHTMTEAQPPDLVQLTTMILEEALTRSASQPKIRPRAELITSAMSVLSALLQLPLYSNRVWLFLRSSSALFGTDRNVGFASAVLAAERITGHYTMTLGLLHLVQQLFREASSSLLTVLPENARLQQVKEEVLLRAARFVHAEIWIEYVGWKYAQIGDRFEIGKRVAAFYAEVLEHSPPSIKDIPFSALSRAVADALLYKATMSTINPLVSSMAGAGVVLGQLYASHRYGDAKRLNYLLESHLRLIRVVLNCKQKTSTSGTCLLEQVLCSSGNASASMSRSKSDPIDVLFSYVGDRGSGVVVPLEATRVLFALCSSLRSTPQPPSFIAHLSNPEAVVASLVRIVQHPYDELSLRNGVWSFISLAVVSDPALASLFVTGKFRLPDIKGKGKVTDANKSSEPKDTSTSSNATKPASAIEAASEMLGNWHELWEMNPQLLASVLRFLNVVWQHGLEHRSVLQPTRQDPKFWERLVLIIVEELGPHPDCRVDSFLQVDGVRRSRFHEAVSAHAYRTVVKAHVLQIIALDMELDAKFNGAASSTEKPHSYRAIENVLKNEDQVSEYVAEAASCVFDPILHDEFTELVKVDFPALTMDQLQSQEPILEREFGDDFTFSTYLLRFRLQPFRFPRDALAEQADEIEKIVSSINLNLSLSHSQIGLAQAWQLLLRRSTPFLRGVDSVRSVFLGMVATISGDAAAEKRSGDMMATMHGERLSLLLSLIEVAWFSTNDKKEEVQHFITFVKNLSGIIQNQTLSPARSFLGSFTVPFHRAVLQMIYFCARHCRNLARRPKVLQADHRLTIASFLEASLALTIDALRVVFDLARSRLDVELDQDMELLVAAFEQCIGPEISPSSTFWLTRCQETDVIRASFELFVKMDFSGLSELALLRARRRPLYATHVLGFHTALASTQSGAERLASEGLLVAYTNNQLTTTIGRGLIDVVIPELPVDRNPAHRSYCAMMSIVAGVTTSLSRQNHYLDAEVCGFVQLFGDQIARTLSWTVGDPLTLALVEEMEKTVNLFYGLAASVSSANNDTIEKVLRGFSTSALLLLQQLNYALTHPNHLESLLEPITAEERQQLEKDARTSTSQASEVIDPTKRPFLTSVVHKLFRLTSSLLSTLITISNAEKVLIGDQEDWPVKEALVYPHSKVVVGERASLGTLLELGNCTLDVLRLLSGHPAGQAITSASFSLSTYDKPLDVRDAIRTARQNLEGVLFYAVTQLAMWLSKPEFDPRSGDMDMEDATIVDRDDRSVNERRSVRRTSLTLAERLRRGMTGEMVADLQSLLNKSKPVIVKTDEVLGVKGIDLTPILSVFLQQRIVAPV